MSAHLGPLTNSTPLEVVKPPEATPALPVSTILAPPLPPTGSSRISTQDRLYFKMPTIKIGVMFSFSESVDLDTVKKNFGLALMDFPRFRQKVAERNTAFPKWKEDLNFNFDKHFQEDFIKDSASKEALFNKLDELKKQELDWDHPLWRVHLIHQADGTSAMVMLLHHGIADGGRLLSALTYIFEESGHNDFQSASNTPRRDERPSNRFSALDALERVARNVQTTVGSVFRTGASLYELGRAGPDTLEFINSRETKQELCVSCLGEPFHVTDMKKIGKTIDGNRATVNDVVVAIISQGLRRYLTEQGVSDDELQSSRITCGIPWNMRTRVKRKDGVPKLGNHTAGVSISLDLGISDPLEQLTQARNATTAVKKTLQSHLSQNLIKLVAVLPKPVTQSTYRRMSDKLTVLITNVRGPAQPWMLGAHKIEDIFCSIDGESSLGLGVLVLSYTGRIQLILQTDPGVIADSEALRGHVLNSYQELLAAASE